MTGFEDFNTMPNGKDTAVAKDWLRHREEATRAGKKTAQLVGLLCKQEGLSWIPRARGKIPGIVAQEMGGSPRSADQSAQPNW